MRSKKVMADKVDLSWCITLKEERLQEETPNAYKPITPVEAQENGALIQSIVKT